MSCLPLAQWEYRNFGRGELMLFVILPSLELMNLPLPEVNYDRLVATYKQLNDLTLNGQGKAVITQFTPRAEQ